jgi:hypothetical protein
MKHKADKVGPCSRAYNWKSVKRINIVAKQRFARSLTHAEMQNGFKGISIPWTL